MANVLGFVGHRQSRWRIALFGQCFRDTKSSSAHRPHGHGQKSLRCGLMRKQRTKDAKGKGGGSVRLSSSHRRLEKNKNKINSGQELDF